MGGGGRAVERRTVNRGGRAGGRAGEQLSCQTKVGFKSQNNEMSFCICLDSANHTFLNDKYLIC